MGILLSVLFLGIAYVSYVSNGKKATPVLIFSLLWGTIMLAESMHLFGLYKSSLLTYGVIATGVLAFATGSLLFKHVLVKGAMIGGIGRYDIKVPLFFVLMLITILLFFWPARLNISLLLSGVTMGEMRSSFGDGYTSKALQLLYNYVALPYSLACLPLTAMLLIINTSRKIKIAAFLMTVLMIVERVIVDAGRGIMLYFFVILFFAYVLYGEKNFTRSNAKRAKTFVAAVFFVVVVCYVAVSLFRGTALSDLYEQIYCYICGCVPFLSSNLQVIDQEQVCLFGAGGLHGPLQFIFTMLENSRLMGYPEFMVQSDVWYKQSLLVRSISPLCSFNAYATTFYNMYLDGGVFAVFLEMLLYGSFTRCVFNVAELQTNNLRAKCVYLFLIYGLVFSFIRFQFSLSRNFISLIFILLVTGRSDVIE